ncbi:MAG: phage tail protein [Rhodobacter sp.]|nr:phage tail protein [Rhodobacter sp.]
MAVQPSFRLDPITGWRVAHSDGIAWNRAGARLAQRPGDIRPIDDPSGDLGGRAMPRRLAAGPGGQLYLITSQGRLVWYDPCTERFAPMPCGQDGRLGLADPIALSVTPGGELLVLDAVSRMVTVYWLADWRLRRHIGPLVAVDGDLRPTTQRLQVDPATGRPDGTLDLPADAWEPRDVAALPDGRVAVSDRRTGRVAFFDARGCLLFASDGGSEDHLPLRGPDALAVGSDGEIFVLEVDGPAIARLDRDGRITARSDDGAGLPDPIEAASLAVDRDGTIWVSSRMPGAAVPHFCAPSGRIAPFAGGLQVPPECDLLAFDPDGHALLGTPRQPCLLRSEQVARLDRGEIVFDRLDGGRAATVWDRVRLEAEIPEGATLRLFAYTSDSALDAVSLAALPASAWISTGLSARDGRAVAAVRTTPGRYLWLRLEFAGDGTATPVLGALTVTYPRQSSARHLPAAWSSEPQSADFLARFMLLFDEVRADALQPLNTLAALIDPMATPAAEMGAHGPDFLDWLAGWIGLSLDRNWPAERRRQLVAEAPALFRIRGTVEGLRRTVEIYTGLDPRLVEHYRMRRWLTLDESRLDGSEALWGPDMIRRLELDSYAEIGRFALVDGGDPLTDPVAVFAHRATVYVPVSEDFSDADLAGLEAVVDAARPAHVAVDVRVMRPQFVIGCDTLLGVNTVLGSGIQTAVTDASILGEDIRLAGPPHALSLSPGTRLGIDTTLD